MTTIFDASKIDEGKSAEQLCAERLQRGLDVIELKQPDRIPIMMPFGCLLADLEGATRRELYEDHAKAEQAMIHALNRFQPDFAIGMGSGIIATPEMSRVLGDRMTKWPGYGLEDNQSFQFHESDFMKQEDYDDFIDDPGDWAIRKYLPRAFKELEGLAMLPRLGMASYGVYGMLGNVATLSLPPLQTAFAALAKASTVQMSNIVNFIQTLDKLASLGFPPAPFGGVLAEAPFDFMSDTLRGMRGIFLDIRRCPEKLLAAQEKVIGIQLENCIATCQATNRMAAFVPLHRGADGFISIPVFEKFYWPQLKKLLLGLIDAGITPTVFWEGAWDQRLNYLAELPKGKTVGWFQKGDIFKVKEVLGDTMCIMGGMKVSMLNGGVSADEIRAYTKRLCQEVGKGGGFIMSTDIAEMEGAKPELIQVWADATREFGKY